jgi:ppGpp synthetase/RelA/SpoT-type nucleotidyltranferase
MAMTISDDTIRKAVQRYQREQDRYLKLAARVADICRFEIIEGNAIRAQVTSRAKSPKSLESKLRRFSASGKKSIPSVDSVFDQIRDLAAVRIATYEQRHEDQVVSLVCRRFIGHQANSPIPERKDKNRNDPENFYRATHLEVFLTPSDIVGTYSNVSDVPCEIQVCSMMAHVWNEVEHDLGYKPAVGELSPAERRFLKMLGSAVRTGDETIESLFAETERRQQEQGGTFADVYDFVARLRGGFPGAEDFGRHAGALFEALQPLRLVSPDSIHKAIGLPEPLTTIAQQAAEDLMRRVGDEARFSVNLTSSDLLLVLLLPKAASFLAHMEPITEGAARVRWFAEQYLKAEAGAA